MDERKGGNKLAHKAAKETVLDFTAEAMVTLVLPELSQTTPKNRREVTTMVDKKMPEDLIPRYGLPSWLRFDNGPVFISQVTLSLVKVLGTNWKLHCAYYPQSSGQAKRINWTLQETLPKLTLETSGDWVALLLYALYNTPLIILGLTSFEILYGRHPPLLFNLPLKFLQTMITRISRRQCRHFTGYKSE